MLNVLWIGICSLVPYLYAPGLMDNVETQVQDVMELPTPGPTPIKPMSFDEKAEVRRAKFQNKPLGDATLTPSTVTPAESSPAPLTLPSASPVDPSPKEPAPAREASEEPPSKMKACQIHKSSHAYPITVSQCLQSAFTAFGWFGAQSP